MHSVNADPLYDTPSNVTGETAVAEIVASPVAVAVKIPAWACIATLAETNAAAKKAKRFLNLPSLKTTFLKLMFARFINEIVECGALNSF